VKLTRGQEGNKNNQGGRGQNFTTTKLGTTRQKKLADFEAKKRGRTLKVWVSMGEERQWKRVVLLTTAYGGEKEG